MMKRFFVSLLAFVFVFTISISGAFAFTTLKVGSKGNDVKTVQTVLKNHNLSTKVDGKYGNGTAKLVKQYQRMHHISATGTVNQKTWNYMLNKIDIESCQLIQPKDELPFKLNAKSDDVKFVQKILKAHGYAVKVDGKYGSDTVKYVKLYQKAHYLKADGKVGPDTWESMSYSYKILPYVFPKAKVAYTKSRFPINAKSGSSASDIKSIQQALQTKDPTLTLKDSKGNYSGVFDAATINAVKAFQTKNNIKVTDPVCVDEATWAALFFVDVEGATKDGKQVGNGIDDNIDLLAKIISCEAGGSNNSEQIAIARVVIDHAGSKSIKSELKADGRYSPCDNWTKFMAKKPGSRCYDNAKKAYYENINVFGGKKAYFFHAKSYVPTPHSWWRQNANRYGLVDKHVFYGK